MLSEYKLAKVTDMGDKFKVHYVVENKNTYYDSGKMYVKVSSLTGDKIQEFLKEGITVFIPKGLEREVLPVHLITEEAKDKIETKRTTAKSRLRPKVNEVFMSLSAFTFYEFFTVNNMLASKGIFITEENREEKYLEILNTGDDVLIDYLERYLEAMDKIEIHSSTYKQCLQAEKDIENASTEEEIDEIINTYLQGKTANKYKTMAGKG